MADHPTLGRKTGGDHPRGLEISVAKKHWYMKSFCNLESFEILRVLTLFPTVGFSHPQTNIANYGVFWLENMLSYHLTFHITGLPFFWAKKRI